MTRWSAKQKKVIDDHCTSQWALKLAGPWAEFEHNGIAKIKAEAGHEVYTISAAQLAEWRKAAAPLHAQMGRGRQEGRRRSGKAAIAELRADLKKENAAY